MSGLLLMQMNNVNIHRQMRGAGGGGGRAIDSKEYLSLCSIYVTSNAL